MRGEQYVAPLWHVRPMGSPPLARGTERRPWRQHGRRRITPACAGNSIKFFPPIQRSRDHPRLRGEQVLEPLKFRVAGGSPPLARGTGFHPSRLPQRRGITPACAGNSLMNRPLASSRRDHPRLRGEQALCVICCRNFVGSPPLARGTGYDILCVAASVGITPACAGNRPPYP